MFDHVIREEIVSTLKNRQSNNLNKNLYNSKTPWIRMNSLMQIDDDDNLRKLWELSSGLQNNKFGLYNVYNSSEAMYSAKNDKIVTLDNKYDLTNGSDRASNPLLDVFQQSEATSPQPYGMTKNVTTYKSYKDPIGSPGLRPMPGIKSITVKNKGSFGSVREATIEFACWDINQLTMLELFYMAFGNSILLEWGWSIDTMNGSHISALDSLRDAPLYDDKALLQIIDHMKKTHGHYDAMQGIVCDFQHSLNEQGGFDCSTTITSIADMFLETEMHSASKNLQKTDISEDKVIIENFKNEIDAIYKYKTGKHPKFIKNSDGALAFNPAYLSEDNPNTTIFDEDYNIIRYVTDYKIDSENATNTDDVLMKKISANDDKQYYTSVGHLSTMFNNSLFPSNTDSNVVKLNTNNVYINYRPGIISGDPAVCLLSTYLEPSGEVTKANGVIYPNHAYKLKNVENLLRNIKLPSPVMQFDANGKLKLNSILINVQYLYDTYSESKTTSEFLMSIFNKISESCGNLWHFQILIDEDKPNEISIIDKNSEYATKLPEIFEFKVYHKNSIVKDINVTTVVTEEIKAMTMYGTNKNGSSAGNTSSYGLLLFGTKLKNLVYKDISQGVLTSNDITYDTDYNYFEQIKETSDKLYDKYTVDAANNCKTALNKYVIDIIKVGNTQVADKQVVILPINIAITIDGISGIKFGNVISIDYLPNRYVRNTYFMIKDVTHIVNTSEWTTTIDTVIQLKSANAL